MQLSKLIPCAAITLTTLFSTSAFASGGEGSYPFPETASTSSLTRAEVHAELLKARREGTLLMVDSNYPTTAPQTSSRTRAEVRAELKEARRAGYPLQVDRNYPESVLSISSRLNPEG